MLRKSVFVTLSSFIALASFARNADTLRFHSQKLGTDSVIVFLSGNYEMIDKSCARIIRFGHYDFKNRHYIGIFVDILSSDSVIEAKGTYSKSGLKEGMFFTFYSNGKPESAGRFANDRYDGTWVFYYKNGSIQAKGAFLDGEYIGTWNFYYEDGRPKAIMSFSDKSCRIQEAWDEGGLQKVRDGYGTYAVENYPFKWSGKIAKGVPDSTWSFHFSENVYGDELFKDGRFIKGDNFAAQVSEEYTKASRIVFGPHPPALIIVNAEHFRPALNGCTFSFRGSHIIKYFD